MARGRGRDRGRRGPPLPKKPKPAPKYTPGGKKTRGEGRRPERARVITKSPQQVGFQIKASGHLRKGANEGRRMKVGVRTDIAAQGRASQAAQAAIPGGDGGGGGGWELPSPQEAGGELADLHDIEFEEYEVDYQDANVPSWWKAWKPKDREMLKRPDVAYLTMLNSIIPYLSPEDQRNAAAQLYTAHGQAFAGYKQSAIEEVEPGKKTITHEQALLSDAYKADPTQFNVMDRDYFTSKARATGFIDALNQMRLAVGNADETGTGFKREHIGGSGEGYRWLQQLAGMGENYGGDPLGGQTNADYMAYLGGIDPLMSLGESELIGPVAAIGQMFAKPFFSAGALHPTYQTPTGQTALGSPNKLLF